MNPKDPRESVLKPVLRWTAIGFYLVFTVVFGGLGWALIIASIARLLRAHNETVLMNQFPNEPWKWRVEWLKPAIKSNQGFDAITEICFAIFWNAATFPPTGGDSTRGRQRSLRRSHISGDPAY